MNNLTIDTLPHDNNFVPVITEDDMDYYILFRQFNSTFGADPRNGINDTYGLMQVMAFLCQVAELKSMEAKSQPEHFEYETVSYGYSLVCDFIAEM